MWYIREVNGKWIRQHEQNEWCVNGSSILYVALISTQTHYTKNNVCSRCQRNILDNSPTITHCFPRYKLEQYSGLGSTCRVSNRLTNHTICLLHFQFLESYSDRNREKKNINGILTMEWVPNGELNTIWTERQCISVQAKGNSLQPSPSTVGRHSIMNHVYFLISP